MLFLVKYINCIVRRKIMSTSPGFDWIEIDLFVVLRNHRMATGYFLTFIDLYVTFTEGIILFG